MRDIGEWFNGLETWQKIALVVGALGLILLIWRPWQRSSGGSESQTTETTFTTPISTGYSYAGPYDMGTTGIDAGSTQDILDEMSAQTKALLDAIAAAVKAQTDATKAASTTETDALKKLWTTQPVTVQDTKEKPLYVAPVSTPAKPATPAKPTTPAKPATPAKKTYTVVKGDTLSGIARKLGIKDWHTLYNNNKKVIGSNPNLIKPGQKLTY